MAHKLDRPVAVATYDSDGGGRDERCLRIDTQAVPRSGGGRDTMVARPAEDAAGRQVSRVVHRLMAGVRGLFALGSGRGVAGGTLSRRGGPCWHTHVSPNPTQRPPSAAQGHARSLTSKATTHPFADGDNDDALAFYGGGDSARRRSNERARWKRNFSVACMAWGIRTPARATLRDWRPRRTRGRRGRGGGGPAGASCLGRRRVRDPRRGTGRIDQAALVHPQRSDGRGRTSRCHAICQVMPMFHELWRCCEEPALFASARGALGAGSGFVLVVRGPSPRCAASRGAQWRRADFAANLRCSAAGCRCCNDISRTPWYRWQERMRLLFVRSPRRIHAEACEGRRHAATSARAPGDIVSCTGRSIVNMHDRIASQNCVGEGFPLEHAWWETSGLRHDQSHILFQSPLRESPREMPIFGAIG